MSRRVWITGAGGLIGSHLARTAPVHCQVRALTRDQLDLANLAKVTQAFQADRPEWIIHCAALSKSPECQSNPDLAWRLNFAVTRHLAELAADARLAFFSTDLVFDGITGQYAETAPVNPLSVYGETKAAAEQLVLANPRHLVIRTSLTAGNSPTGDRGFDEQLRLAWQRGEIPRLFTDEYRSPIAAPVTARAVWELIARECSGLFHLAGSEKLSRWEIGRLLQDGHPELNPHIQASSLRDYRGAPRAPDTTLDCRKAQGLLSFPLPGFRDWFDADAKTRSNHPPP